MFRLTLVTFALLALMASALHAQVPYTQSPYPTWGSPPQPPVVAPYAPAEAYKMWAPKPITPYKAPPLDLTPYPSGETAWDRMQRESREERERITDRKLREFQSDNLERTIRCNRFGSREVNADCMNW